MTNQIIARLLALTDWQPEDEQLALSLPEHDRVYLAKHIKHYDGILIDFSHDQQLAVREAVASNRYTPVNILHYLSQEDEALRVRHQAQQTIKEVQQ